MAKKLQPKKVIAAKKAAMTKKAVAMKKKIAGKVKTAVKAAKKAVSAKKTAPLKKAVLAKKKAIVKKAVAVEKKVAVKTKAVVKAAKKAVGAKKTAPLKKAILAKKKAIVKKAVAVEKKVAVKTKAVVKAARKAVTVKKIATPKKTTPKKKEPEKISSSYGKELKAILLKKREDLLKEIFENRVRESDPLKRDVGDIYDEASTERERELSLILGDRDRQTLIEIDDALLRMESGEYGVCESCGDRIALGRLKAQPFTKLCINCKAEEERQEARQKKFEVEGVYRNVNQPEEEEV